MGSFVEGIAALAAMTPERVEGRVEVNQIYAHYQHEHPEFRHPRGGQAFYLKAPLYTKSSVYLHWLADALLKGELGWAMARSMEDLSSEVHRLAPVEFEDLRNSGHPTVVADGAKVYDRAPLVPRLSDEQLRLKGKLRYLLRRA